MHSRDPKSLQMWDFHLCFLTLRKHGRFVSWRGLTVTRTSTKRKQQLEPFHQTVRIMLWMIESLLLRSCMNPVNTFLTVNRSYFKLRQCENPVHRHSDVCEVFLFFREQFAESLVSTKRNKDLPLVAHWKNNTSVVVSSHHLQEDFLFSQECQLLKRTEGTFRWMQWLMTWI